MKHPAWYRFGLPTGLVVAKSMRMSGDCPVCGGAVAAVICAADEVKAQLAFLERFHRRRLRPAGDGDDHKELADRADFTQDYATDIVRCSTCGLVLRETRPRAQAVTRAYARDEYGRERLEALFSSQLELFRTKSTIVRRLLPTPDAPAIVEVGSFVGGFLAAGREQGWHVVGLDPGEEVDVFCRQKGFEVVRATVEAAPVTPHSVDCVAIWNTFDQLPDPQAAMTTLRQWLKVGGLLVVRVPNGACFGAALERLHRLPTTLASPLLTALAWNNLLGFPYLYGYSPETLTVLLRRFDLRLELVCGDVLTRLADQQTKYWARWEEWVVKTAWLGVARSHPDQAPWIDLYYRAV